ncbi:hypothetical protein PK35_04950 [Tamlana nanhaiensis]|uniref:Uncharacterized protein n=1 Tax=Neotamlana nanhaiensis TaxID=1382798 RepID=A0A0D7W4N3_9FLAO|nr:hypothetical protein [Tamlana nanhaiensis]KJD34081.1 hypothetical protein PK35_04950 [Tamlana nanhaiensis]
MMKVVELKQKVSFQIKAQFGIPLVVFCCAISYINLIFFPLALVSICLMFVGYSYLFRSDFKHKMVITVFGFKLIYLKKTFLNPDYISLFPQSYKQTNAFGFLEFGQSKWKEYTIKFFSSNRNQTVFRSENKEDVLTLGVQLSDLLGVKLYNKLK